MFVDVGCFSNGTIGWGLILKNHEGTVVHNECKLDTVEVDPCMAEALGVRWALSSGIQWLKLSSDALNVVDCVNMCALVAAIDPIISDCWNLIEQIPFVMVNHVSRELNT